MIPPKRIMIAAWGSRGDLQPVTALALALKNVGRDLLVFATPPALPWKPGSPDTGRRLLWAWRINTQKQTKDQTKHPCRTSFVLSTACCVRWKPMSRTRP